MVDDVLIFLQKVCAKKPQINNFLASALFLSVRYRPSQQKAFNHRLKLSRFCLYIEEELLQSDLQLIFFYLEWCVKEMCDR